RVAIMDHGRVLALDTPDALKSSLGAGTIVTVTADGDLAQLALLLGREVQGVALSRQVENTVVLHAMQARGLLPQLLNAAEGGGFGVRDVSVSEPTLENVFIHLTGKDLRDCWPRSPLPPPHPPRPRPWARRSAGPPPG